MAHFFRAPDRRQRFLLPVDMMDWLPEDDIVHLIVDAVGLIDLSGSRATCKVGHAGQPPFAPAICWRCDLRLQPRGAIEPGDRAAVPARRWLLVYRRRRGAGPHRNRRFRQRHAGRMKSVFLQVLELCREAGLIRLGLVALDGTR